MAILASPSSPDAHLLLKTLANGHLRGRPPATQHAASLGKDEVEQAAEPLVRIRFFLFSRRQPASTRFGRQVAHAIAICLRKLQLEQFPSSYGRWRLVELCHPLPDRGIDIRNGRGG